MSTIDTVALFSRACLSGTYIPVRKREDVQDVRVEGQGYQHMPINGQTHKP